MKTKKIFIIFLLIYISGMGLKSFANSAMEIPENLNPGVVGKDNLNSFRKDTYKEQRPAKNSIKVDEDLKTVGYDVAVSKNSQINPEFSINKIVFVGNTVMKEKKLKKFSRKLEGKKIKIDDLINLCNEITDYYKNKGYVTSRAKLLTQRIDDGVVEITINEGKYGDITVEGNKWAKEKYLNNILQTNGIDKDKVLNVNTLSKSITDINNKNYIKGNIVIHKGEKADLNDITLDVKDRLPLNLSADWNNYGTETTGMQRSFIKLSYDNLTGYGDSLYGGAILGQGNAGAMAGYSIPVGSKGTRLNLGYSLYNVQYDGLYRNLGLKGNWQNYSVGITQPLYRNDKWTVDSAINFDICDVKQSMDAIGDLTNEKLRVLRTGIFARRDDNKGFWASGVQVSTGLPILGATEAGNGLGADGKFVKVNLNLNRIQVLPKRCMALLSLNGQYTPNELLSPEKIALGGMNLRGYETATIVGDGGVFGTIELRTPVPFLKKLLPKKLKKYEENVKMGYFYDFGVVSDINGYNNVLSNKSTNLLQSVGVGLHFPISNLLTVNLDLGMPIGDRAFITQGARMTFSVSSSLQNMWGWKDIGKQRL